MKTFTAHEFTRTPDKVYREADRHGKVRINHDRYKDKVFILVAKERHQQEGSE